MYDRQVQLDPCTQCQRRAQCAAERTTCAGWRLWALSERMPDKIGEDIRPMN